MKKNSNFPKYDFSDEEMAKNLRAKSLIGGAATYGGKMVGFVIQIAGISIFARILEPEDFGLVAMVTALTGFAMMFQDAGLSMATVQKEKITHEQVNALFWIISGISFLLMLASFALSPFVAWLYGDSRLLMITMASACSIFFGGLGIQHRTLLRREMRFPLISGIEIGVQFSSTVIAILMGLSGMGYWALVGMNVLRPLIATSLLWLFCPWRPGRPRKEIHIRSMVVFGGHISVAKCVDYLVKNVDNILIGTVLGSHVLGLYSKAYSLMMLPIRQVNLPMTNIVLPALSRLQSDTIRYRNYFRKALFFSTIFTMPIIIFSFVAAEEIIFLILGAKWQGTVPLFRALVPAVFVYTFNGALGWSLIPIGKAKKFMYVFLFEGICTILAFLVGIRWGAIGVASALSIQVILTRPFSLWYSFRNSVTTCSDLLGPIFRPAISSMFAGIVLHGFRSAYLGHGLSFNLICMIPVYLSLYVVALIAIPGGREELRSITGYFHMMRRKASSH